jgi:hypothetical protein
MKKSTKILIGVLAVGGLAAGGIAYAKMHKPATPAGTPPAGLPMTSVTLQPGQKYLLAAAAPAGVTDSISLTNALNSAGWTQVSVNVFNGAGTAPVGMTALPGEYIATAIWNGAANTPNPTNVEIVPVTG